MEQSGGTPVSGSWPPLKSPLPLPQGEGWVGSRLAPKVVTHGQCARTSRARLGTSLLVVWSHSRPDC